MFCFVLFHFDWNILPCWYLVLTFPASMSALCVFALVGQKEVSPAQPSMLLLSHEASSLQWPVMSSQSTEASRLHTRATDVSCVAVPS